MARVPRYPYRVIVTIRNGSALHTESHNYTTLPGAFAFRDIALHKHNTRHVEICMVLDESTPGHHEVPEIDLPRRHSGNGGGGSYPELNKRFP